MSASFPNKLSKEADRTLLMLILHFVTEPDFETEHWETIASVLSEQEAKPWSAGRCWSRYGSLMYEARRKLGPGPVADMAGAATEAEFELDVDIEAAMAEAADAESSTVQPAHHHHRSPALAMGKGHEVLDPKMQGSDQRKRDHSATFHSTSTSPGVTKDRDYRRKWEVSRVTKNEQQLSIKGWVSRN